MNAAKEFVLNLMMNGTIKPIDIMRILNQEQIPRINGDTRPWTYPSVYSLINEIKNTDMFKHLKASNIDQQAVEKTKPKKGNVYNPNAAFGFVRSMKNKGARLEDIVMTLKNEGFINCADKPYDERDVRIMMGTEPLDKTAETQPAKPKREIMEEKNIPPCKHIAKAIHNIMMIESLAYSQRWAIAGLVMSKIYDCQNNIQRKNG